MKTISAAAALFWTMLASSGYALAETADDAKTIASESKSAAAQATDELAKINSEQDMADDSLKNQTSKNSDISKNAVQSGEIASEAALAAHAWQYVPFNPLSGKTFHKESLMFKKGGVSVFLSFMPISDKLTEKKVADEVAKRIDCSIDTTSEGYVYPERDADLSKRIDASGSVLPQGSFYKISCGGAELENAQDASNAKDSPPINSDATAVDAKIDEPSSPAAQESEDIKSKTEEKSIPAWDAEILPADIYVKRGSREYLAIAIRGGDLADFSELMVQRQKEAIVYQQTKKNVAEARKAAADKAIEEIKKQAIDETDAEIQNPEDLPPDEILKESKEIGIESVAELTSQALLGIHILDDGKSGIYDKKNISKPADTGKVDDKKRFGE